CCGEKCRDCGLRIADLLGPVGERISMSATEKEKQPGQTAPDNPQSAIRNPQSVIPLMIVAGGASGDKHAAKLVAALRALSPDLQFEFFGAGGDEMRQAGIETYVDAREVAIMGALEVARVLPKFLRVFRRLRDAANERKPRLVILIDWPEFNLRLAERLKSDGHTGGHYINPQYLGLRSFRIYSIKT